MEASSNDSVGCIWKERDSWAFNNEEENVQGIVLYNIFGWIRGLDS